LERISIISGYASLTPCCGGGQPGDVDVDRNDTVATTHHRIRIVIIAAAVGHEPMEIT
jgi:hypothetical protein